MDSIFSEEWNTFWAALSAIGTFAVVFVALFLERLLEAFRRPKLKLTFDKRDIEMQPEHGAPESMWLRIRVENLKGRRVARACRAFLMRIESNQADGQAFIPDEHLHVRQLSWTHNPDTQPELPRDLLPGIPQFVDLLNTYNRHQNLDVHSIPKKVLVAEATYRFTIQVSAEDANPEAIQLVVRWKGKWADLDVSTV